MSSGTTGRMRLTLAEMPAGFRRDQSENPAFRSCRNSNSTQTGPLADSREVVTVK
ncbi:hypothetical protein [Bacteroides faecis]|uniref:hypothetical protein n=1 Tax=Bacteroides faecis TaxID=674529 RepID=UPI0039B64CFD|nr:hypothetical protein [Bacteroides faecis]